jgi:prepilin-type N-terminal cleavage/methylation domain-containing protein
MKIRTSRKAGFTIVELMIVVAIIGLLAAIAIPSFVRSRSMSQMNACINNLRQIDGAKQRWAMENGKITTDSPLVGDIGPYMGRSGLATGAGIFCPIDPAKGFGTSYTIGSVATAPICQIGGTAGSQYDASYPHVLN